MKTCNLYLLLLGAGLAYGAASPAAAENLQPTRVHISGGIICDSLTELTAMLDLVADGHAHGLLPGCGFLTTNAAVLATKVGTYDRGAITGVLYRYEDSQTVQFGIQRVIPDRQV